uniref:CHUP1 n=1 Tax=Arundo donax TaxID=35708 RepID=A0A0A9GWX4_ARUDO
MYCFARLTHANLILTIKPASDIQPIGMSCSLYRDTRLLLALAVSRSSKNLYTLFSVPRRNRGT